MFNDGGAAIELDGKNILDLAVAVIGKAGAVEKEEENPFIAGLVIKTKKKKKNTGTSEVYNAEGVSMDFEAAEVSQVHYVDKGYFVKVMNKAIVAAFGMTAAGQKMFWYLMAEVAENVGGDSVYLHYSQAKSQRGKAARISKNIYYRGMAELEGAGFIAANTQKKGFYWINPGMLFNGDRITLVNTYILKQDAAGRRNPDGPRIQRPGLKCIGGPHGKTPSRLAA